MAAGEEKLKLVLEAIDKTAAPIRKVNRRIESMLAPVRKVKRALRSLSVESGLPKLGKELSRLGRIAGRFAVAGVAAFGALGAAVVKVSEQTDAIGKLSRQIGIGAEAFQEFEFAADRAGVSQDVFRNAVGALSKRVGELKRGGGALKVFEQLLPDVTDRLKASKDTGEALEIISAAIARVSDPMKKAALASAAFSRAGLPMIRLANEGSEGIAALRAEARALGVVLSSDAVAGAEAVQDSLTNMKASVGGLVSQVSSQLFPVVRDIADSITKWTVANRELIQVRAKEAILGIVSAGKSLLAWLRRVVPPTLAFIESIGGFKTVAIVVGVILAATLLPAIVAIGGAIATIGGLFVTAGAAMAVALGPIGLVVAGVGAAFAAAATLIATNWDAIRETVIGTIDSIVDRTMALIPSIPAPVRRLLGLEGGASVSVSAPAPVATAAALAPAAEAAAAAPLGGGGGKSLLKVVVEDARVRIKQVEADPALELDTAGGEALQAG